MIKKETKENIRVLADIAVIVGIMLGVFQIYSWSQDYKLSHDTLEKQEQEKNIPPTIFLIQNITGKSDNFTLIPTFYFKKNSNKHFVITYFSMKMGRDSNKNISIMSKKNSSEKYRFFVSYKYDNFYESDTSDLRFLNFSDSSEKGVFQPGIKYYRTNFDYNPIIKNNYTAYNSNNKDINIEYDIEIEDLDSQISYIGIIKTKMKGDTVYPRHNRIYRPLKFNWTNIGIQNEDDGMSLIEQQKLLNDDFYE